MQTSFARRRLARLLRLPTLASHRFIFIILDHPSQRTTPHLFGQLQFVISARGDRGSPSFIIVGVLGEHFCHPLLMLMRKSPLIARLIFKSRSCFDQRFALVDQIRTRSTPFLEAITE